MTGKIKLYRHGVYKKEMKK